MDSFYGYIVNSMDNTDDDLNCDDSSCVGELSDVKKNTRQWKNKRNMCR